MDLSTDFENIQAKVNKLQKVADTQIAKPMKFKEYTRLNDQKYHWNRFRDHNWGSFNNNIEYYFWKNSGWGREGVTQESLYKVLTQWDSAFKVWVEDNKETFEYNKTVAEHNQLQYERISTIMETIGVPKVFSRSFYKTSRSRKLTTERTSAQWPSEIRAALPSNCGYEHMLKQIQDKRDTIERFGEKWIKDNIERLRKEAEEERAKEKEQRKLKVLAGLCVKYCLDLEAEPCDILDSILDQDKYLHLAHYLLMNRNDWNDGYSYAETGLNGFTVESDKDQDIEDAVLGIIQGDDIDGRYFRDNPVCSYDVLFGMSDEKVLEDYNLINEFIEQH